MTTRTILLLAVLFFSTVTFAVEKRLINFDWKFTTGDIENAQLIDFNDSKWQTVQLPHDASIYGAFVKTGGVSTRNGFRPRNIGWYRKNITIDKNEIGKKIYIEFEGVHRASDVWVNGKHCGTFLNGYLDFQYDISNLLVAGNNVIAVRYNNTFPKSSRWYTGEGINRNVYLHIKEQVHVDRYGTSITTPKINQDQAKVVVETTIKNNLKESTDCKLVTDIVSPSGQVVASYTSVVPLNGVEKYEFHQELSVPKPMIWDIKHPHLYKSIAKVYVNDKLTDVYETNFGIREVEFNPEQGFLLNGEKVFLKGVCVHHDLGPLGAAALEAGWNKRLSVLKNEMGCNAIRLSHNPYPKYVLDWCDKNGILVFDEAYDKWDEQYYGPGNDFADYWKADVETFIKRDRNHPSVFIWSVGNEVYQQIRADEVKKGISLSSEMVNFVHKLEPSRKVTFGMFPNRFGSISHRQKGYLDAEPHPMAFQGDVMSVNYMSQFFTKDHKKYPQLTFLISEEVTQDDGMKFFEYDHSYAAGQFYWGGTEYIGESFGWPSKGWINGAIDLSNNLKSAGQSIKSFYNDTPMVHIAVWDKKEDSLVWNDVKITSKPKYSDWNRTEGDSLTVQVFSNCDTVELFINGKSQGEKKINPARPEFIWKVKYQKGEVKAIGKNKGQIVAEHQIKTAGKPYQILLEADKENLKADGFDLSYLTVKIVDKEGNVVPDKDHKINFKVSGAGINAGVDNGDITSSELWQSDFRSTYKGKCQLIVRADRQEGDIKIEATAVGLKKAKQIIKVKR